MLCSALPSARLPAAATSMRCTTVAPTPNTVAAATVASRNPSRRSAATAPSSPMAGWRSRPASWKGLPGSQPMDRATGSEMNTCAMNPDIPLPPTPTRNSGMRNASARRTGPIAVRSKMTIAAPSTTGSTVNSASRIRTSSTRVRAPSPYSRHQIPSFFFRISLSACGLALPPEAFIAWPTNQPSIVGFASTLATLSGIGGDDLVDHLLDRAEVGDLLHAALLDDRGRVAALVVGDDDLQQVLGDLARDRRRRRRGRRCRRSAPA